ncbi:unnamed protein product [Ranitomeya imitator]|uniref:Anoctamin dimerisation domain-containing protein n=1 Tax=Ranitomeya imitator TaxID=111125 RepID=A0ABN9L9Y4_9NEOB|nr:unnamed protein product [Ranitomeya imitator]
MFTLVTRGLRHRWSLESCLCDSDAAAIGIVVYIAAASLNVTLMVPLAKFTEPLMFPSALWTLKEVVAIALNFLIVVVISEEGQIPIISSLAPKDGNQGKHRVTKRGPVLSNPMFTLVTGIVGRWRAVCVTALQRPNSDAAAIRIVVGIAAASLNVNFILSRVEYAVKDNVKKFGINKLLDSGIYKAAFPLHDCRFNVKSEDHRCPNERYLLYREWAHPFSFYKLQPLDLVRVERICSDSVAEPEFAIFVQLWYPIRAKCMFDVQFQTYSVRFDSVFSLLRNDLGVTAYVGA